ncbi:MAG: hypothetical protein RBG13Loki_0997 [Promethearchaeota archaeon CR_4]|nr:MAG: hypothetical protein RBG13Loki_0997 [Candidatus Lokiarchaeota archaeon CR_4]
MRFGTFVGLEYGRLPGISVSAHKDFRQEILFIDIGGSQESYFTWSNSETGSQFSKIDVITARSVPGNAEDYVYMKRNEYKLIFRQLPHPERGFTKILFVIGASLTCQYQVMEAFLDFLGEQWFARFGGNTNFTSGPKLFESFDEDINLAFEMVPKDRIKTVQIQCRACNQYFKVHVKKALIDHASSFPVPLVFVHANHALLIYIDQNYRSRGERIVNITG